MTELEIVDVYVNLSANINIGMVHNITNQNPALYPPIYREHLALNFSRHVSSTYI